MAKATRNTTVIFRTIARWVPGAARGGSGSLAALKPTEARDKISAQEGIKPGQLLPAFKEETTPILYKLLPAGGVKGTLLHNLTELR